MMKTPEQLKGAIRNLAKKSGLFITLSGKSRRLLRKKARPSPCRGGLFLYGRFIHD